MADGSNLVEALNTILECVNKSDTSSEVIDSIEAENEKLRREKFELLTKLNQLIKVKSTHVALIKNLTSQLETQKRLQTEFKELSSMRIKELSQRTSEQIKLAKERLRQTEDAMMLPYDKVLAEIAEMEAKTEKNLQKSKILSDECRKQTQQLSDMKKFSENLKKIKQEQTTQLNRAGKNPTRN